MNIYNNLNKEQQKAVIHKTGPLLILAGAGSGKTRVLTYRIAHLIEEEGISPWNLLAITFTNKAAHEMRERVDKIVGYGSQNIWISTFHSTCVRILRRYIELLNFDNNFTIYDSDDQKTLIREIMKYLQLDPKQFRDRMIINVISSAKDKLISPEKFIQSAQGDFIKTTIGQVYIEYQKRLKQNNALDFDDLIFKTVELFHNYPDALEYYQKRFQYIMVDEYQDTNLAQFELIRLMAPTYNEYGEIDYNLCVVGDDDQSIYRFRGANIYNILNFEKYFPDTKIIKLEQNYRSTKNILNAANGVIDNNIGRKRKSLWTENETGDPISFSFLQNEYIEADYIVENISKLLLDYAAEYKDFAILYRTNAQSRILEEKLIVQNIPYRIIGAVNFYQRKEIKDLLCYLKIINNANDDLAVKRIINVPRRGIGLTTIDRVTDYAYQHQFSFYEALLHAESIPGLGRTVNKISSFVSFIEVLKSKLSSPSYSLADLLNEILEATGYQRDLEAENTNEADARLENIDELLNKIITYEQNAAEPTLNNFLEEVSLVADIDTLEEDTNRVILMTLHSAKGLEFPYVYLCGMEEGNFPSYMAISAEDKEELEEERRLCYVGITRAMKHLTLTGARERMKHGDTIFNKPSRFIEEIPVELIQRKDINRTIHPNLLYTNKPKSSAMQMNPFSKNKNDLFANNPYISKGVSISENPLDTPPNYKVGDMVQHIKFGTGIVVNLVKGSRDYEVTVSFTKTGQKKMLASFAKLQKIE